MIKSGVPRAPIHSTKLPISPPITIDSRGPRPLLTLPAPLDLIWASITASILSNLSCPRARILPVQPTTQCLPRPHLVIPTLCPRAAAVAHSQPPMFMLYITMVEARQSLSSLAALVSQNSPRHTRVGLKIRTLPNPPPVLPTTSTPLKGDRDLAPPPVNLKLGSSDRSISCQTRFGGLVSKGVS